jgi:hypothetical protein
MENSLPLESPSLKLVAVRVEGEAIWLSPWMGRDPREKSWFPITINN